MNSKEPEDKKFIACRESFFYINLFRESSIKSNILGYLHKSLISN